MGCGTAREKLEDEMMVYKLERMEVQMQKEKELKKLAEIEGHTIERHQIPDYIDPQFAKEKRLYPIQDENINNSSVKTDKSKKQKKSTTKLVDNGSSKNKKKKK